MASTAMPTRDDFAALLDKSLGESQSFEGKVVKGRVTAIENDLVVIDVGLKSEGRVSIREFTPPGQAPQVSVGDDVDVYVDRVENAFGEAMLSRDRARREAAWDKLETQFNAGERVDGTIFGRVKGGFTVDLGGAVAFLPGSQVDIRPVRDVTPLMGIAQPFQLLKMDRKRGNIVVSRRSILEETRAEARTGLIQSLAEGQVIDGVVKNITDYGAFVDLGGIDGLLHITDMAWKRVRHPSEVVEVGQELDVRVLKYDRERNRVSLGLKQLGEDPWDNIARRYPANTRVFGKVSNVTDYGAFVEIEPGVEGLVHVSEMDWTNKNVNPAKVVQIGDEVEVMILDIDGERRRISLGMKQCRVNPWEEFSQNHQKGDRVRGAIKSITDFGIFIGLPGGIDGLVHLSDLDWNEPGEVAVRRYSKGQEVEAVVLAIDGSRERISLGVKQVSSDPLAAFIADNTKGEIVSGTVTTVDQRGAVIDLGDGVEGYIKANDLSRERVEDATKVLKEGDTLEARFIGVDRKSRTIMLSVREKEIQEEAEVVAEYSRNASTGKTSLGDLLKDQLGNN